MQPNDAQYPSLRDRVVLVTGGGQGIGESTVEHFCAQGAKVTFLDIAREPSEALVERVEARGHKTPRFIPCDVTDTSALQAAIRSVIAQDGPVRALINNAAHDARHTTEDVTPEYWDDRMAINLKHQFFCAKAVRPGMREAGGGSIINFGSISWMNSQGDLPVYVTAKSAVQGLTRGLAREFGKEGIRVNCVVPGWVMTKRQLELWVKPDSGAEIERNQCLPGRLQPSDLARMVLWLAADDSRMCSAQNFIVDAGWT